MQLLCEILWSVYFFPSHPSLLPTCSTYLSQHCSSAAPPVPSSSSSLIIQEVLGTGAREIWFKIRVIIGAGWLTSHLHSWAPPPPRTHTDSNSAPEAPTYSTAGVWDCNYCGRFTVQLQGCEASSKGHRGYRIYLTMCYMCVKYEACVLYEALSNGVSPLTLPLSLLRVGLERVSNTLSVCFPVHHCVHSPDSAL